MTVDYDTCFPVAANGTCVLVEILTSNAEVLLKFSRT